MVRIETITFWGIGKELEKLLFRHLPLGMKRTKMWGKSIRKSTVHLESRRRCDAWIEIRPVETGNGGSAHHKYELWEEKSEQRLKRTRLEALGTQLKHQLGGNPLRVGKWSVVSQNMRKLIKKFARDKSRINAWFSIKMERYTLGDAIYLYKYIKCISDCLTYHIELSLRILRFARKFWLGIKAAPNGGILLCQRRW